MKIVKCVKLLYCHSAALSPELLYAVLGEVPPLLSESDLHIAQLTLHLLTSIAKKQGSALQSAGVSGAILPEVFNLLRSPLLQGGALASLLEFLQALVGFNAPGLSHSSWYLSNHLFDLFTFRYWSWLPRAASRSHESGSKVRFT